MNRFSKFSWFLLIYTIFVIAWGTVVRATNSGAGCGKFWPLCGESLIPTFEVFHTGVEFSHRIMSGLLILLIAILVVWGHKLYMKEVAKRYMVYATFAFTILEAILGAGLVIFGLVESNSSNLRIIAVSIHLLNTFLLLGVLTVNAWWSNHEILGPRGKSRVKTLFSIILGIILLIGVTGAVTALADTLFPSTSMLHTLSEQFEKDAHILKSLRIYHPILAMLFGFGIVYLLLYAIKSSNSTVTKLKFSLIALIIIQLFLGFSNIIFLTPLFIQVLHLMVADLIWIITIILFLLEPDIQLKNYE